MRVKNDGRGSQDNKVYERRIVIAPLYTGGDIADYVLPWSKYESAQEAPWNVGDRIMMQFEGVLTEDESRGIIAVNGGIYYLGRIRSVRRNTPDYWETVMVVFDSDPEDYMWVSPWEIVRAPEKYHGPVHEVPAMYPERALSAEDIAAIARNKAISRRLGWPAGDNRKEFDSLRRVAFAGHLPPTPTFTGVELNLHRVFVEAMHMGGYEFVTRNKLWKTVCRTLGRDLTTQTSASFFMRKSYERCLYPLEKYLADDDVLAKLGIVLSESTDVEGLPGSVPKSYDEFGDDDSNDGNNDGGNDGDDNDDDDENHDEYPSSRAKKSKKGTGEDSDDYKLSDDDFNEDDDSDQGDSDSDSDYK
jgi:hypothetical protein